MVRIGLWLSLLLVCLIADSIVQKEVELDGEVRLHGVSAITCAQEWRLAVPALLPQVIADAVAYLAVVDVRDKEIGVLVVDPACDILDAQPFPPAFKQNLYNVPMVDVFHFRLSASGASPCKFTHFCAKIRKNYEL